MSEPAVIEKRKVTMTSVFAAGTGLDGNPSIATHQAIDYVPTNILDAYVTDARTKWQDVAVGESHDPGPAGDQGETHYPDHLNQATPADDTQEVSA